MLGRKAQGCLQVSGSGRKTSLFLFRVCRDEVGNRRSLRYALGFNGFQRFGIHLATVQEARSKVLSGLHLLRGGWGLHAPGRPLFCGNLCARSRVYSFNGGFRNRKSILANGVLYSSIALARGIGNYAAAVLEMDDISLRGHAQGRQIKECEFGSQSREL